MASDADRRGQIAVARTDAWTPCEPGAGWRLAAAVLLGFWSLLARAAGFEPVAPGVFLLSGAGLEQLAPPVADAGNVALVSGRDGAILVGTGTSRRQGDAVLEAVGALGSPPLRFALLSQALPEFLFGAGALQVRGIPLLAHRRTAALIVQRCDQCLARLREAHGEAAMAGSRVPVVDLRLEGSVAVDLGGRVAEVLDFGWGATPGDLAVLEPESGVLLAGALVTVERIPVLRDADLSAWVAALDRIAALPLRQIVPGHGPVVGKEAVAALRGYLVEVDALVRDLYAARVSLAEALERSDLSAYRGWAGYPEVHRQNVQVLFLALEQAELRGE